MASSFDGSAWATPMTVAGGATSDDLAVAVVPATLHGVGLIHGANDQLDYTLWNGTAWSSFVQLHADVTQGRPTLAGVGGTVHAVYWGKDFHFYYEAFTGGAWTAAPLPVIPTGTAPSLCGPSPPSFTPLGADASLLFVNGSCSGALNHLYGSDLSSGAWQAVKDIASNPTSAANLRPSLTELASGPELLAVYAPTGTSQIQSSYRTAGTWSAAAAIPNGLTNDPVALAPLPGSGAVLAYRGTDDKLYTATFNGTGWTNPAPVFTPNVTIGATPALAKGIGSAGAEMAYVDGAGAVWHTRLLGGTWNAPMQVGTATSFNHVAIASGP
jgi:hypothetical protein